MDLIGECDLVVALERTMRHDRGGLPGGYRGPVALLVPTTAQTLRQAAGLRDAGSALLVGGADHAGFRRPADILNALASAPDMRPDLVVLSDQILAAADAGVLVLRDGHEAYVSAFEAVVNLKYGYRLGVWMLDGFQTIEAGTATSTVLTAVAAHLQDCDSLGDAWDVRPLQGLRSPARRRTDALRTLRFFRSAISNAFQSSPDDPEARLLRERVLVLEHDVITRGV